MRERKSELTRLNGSLEEQEEAIARLDALNSRLMELVGSCPAHSEGGNKTTGRRMRRKSSRGKSRGKSRRKRREKSRGKRRGARTKRRSTSRTSRTRR